MASLTPMNRSITGGLRAPLRSFSLVINAAPPQCTAATAADLRHVRKRIPGADRRVVRLCTEHRAAGALAGFYRVAWGAFRCCALGWEQTQAYD